jgi:hypothetical protein
MGNWVKRAFSHVFPLSPTLSLRERGKIKTRSDLCSLSLWERGKIKTRSDLVLSPFGRG